MKIFIVSHTHWDLEWYLSFEEYRHKLLIMMEKLVETLKNENYKAFHLDAQTALLDSFFELRKNKEIKRLIKKGKLIIGPFYVQPDELLASGEGLIRNLLIGIEESKKFGKYMKVGYIVDTFGHIPALPRILRGFGIKYFIFARGLGDEADSSLEFIWESPDSSQVICYYLPLGYCNLHGLGYEQSPYTFYNFEIENIWKTRIMNIYYEEPNVNFEKAYERAKSVIEKLKKFTKNDFLLLMNGCDHLIAQSKLPEIIDYFNKKGEYEFIHCKLEDFFKYLEKNSKSFNKLKGELRGSKYIPILSGVYSNRVYLKQLNFKALTLMSILESLSSIYYLFKKEKVNEIKYLWELLILNHFHDSIYGSGVDAVHKENEVRFLKAIELATSLIYDLMYKIIQENKLEEKNSIIVFNPLPFKRKTFVEVWLNNFDVNDVLLFKNKRIVPVILEKEGDKTKVGFFADFSPLSFENIYILKSKKRQKSSNIKIGNDFIENYYYIIKYQNNIVNIIDKINNLNYKISLIDEIDLGDEYNYEIKGIAFDSSNVASYIATIANNFYAELIQRINLELKEENENPRSEIIKNPCEIRYRIYEDPNKIEIRMNLANRSKDHRLRLKIETSFEIEKENAETPFYVIERKSFNKIKREDWIEDPEPTKPFFSFVDFIGKNEGIFVITKGLHEYEVDENRKIVYITLLRAVRYLSRERLSIRRCAAGPIIELKDSQCLRDFVFEIALISHKDDWLTNNLHNEALNYIYPIIALESKHSIKEFSLFELKNPKIILSSMKVSENGEGIILRFCNYSNNKEKLNLKLSKIFNKYKIYKSELNEKIIKEIKNLKRIFIKNNDLLTLFIK
jgi:mannosylglycerate hydrolase